MFGEAEKYSVLPVGSHASLRLLTRAGACIISADARGVNAAVSRHSVNMPVTLPLTCSHHPSGIHVYLVHDPQQAHVSSSPLLDTTSLEQVSMSPQHAAATQGSPYPARVNQHIDYGSKNSAMYTVYTAAAPLHRSTISTKS